MSRYLDIRDVLDLEHRLSHVTRCKAADHVRGLCRLFTIYVYYTLCLTFQATSQIITAGYFLLSLSDGSTILFFFDDC